MAELPPITRSKELRLYVDFLREIRKLDVFQTSISNELFDIIMKLYPSSSTVIHRMNHPAFRSQLLDELNHLINTWLIARSPPPRVHDSRWISSEVLESLEQQAPATLVLTLLFQDPDYVRQIERHFKLPVTGRQHKMMRHYARKYYTIHSEKIFVLVKHIEVAARAGKEEVLDQLLVQRRLELEALDDGYSRQTRLYTCLPKGLYKGGQTELLAKYGFRVENNPQYFRYAIKSVMRV